MVDLGAPPGSDGTMIYTGEAEGGTTIIHDAAPVIHRGGRVDSGTTVVNGTTVVHGLTQVMNGTTVANDSSAARQDGTTVIHDGIAAITQGGTGGEAGGDAGGVARSRPSLPIPLSLSPPPARPQTGRRYSQQRRRARHLPPLPKPPLPRRWPSSRSSLRRLTGSRNPSDESSCHGRHRELQCRRQ